MYSNQYYANQLNGKWCLVCKLVSIDCANEFMRDNNDCSLLAYIGGLAVIGFTDDLGKDSVLIMRKD